MYSLKLVNPAVLLFVAIQMLATESHAFITDEGRQWDADIAEAKSRARDFEAYLQRRKKAESAREEFAQVETEKREDFEKEFEHDRKEFVEWRDRRPDETAKRDFMERKWEKAKLEEERQMEANRREYVINRERVRRVIATEAGIDEMKEFDLKP